MSEKGTRTRILTDKGMAQWEEKCVDYDKRLQGAWDSLCKVTDRDLTKVDISSVPSIERDLSTQLVAYESLHLEFSDFLARTRTVESKNKLEELTKLYHRNSAIVKTFRDHLRSLSIPVAPNSVFSALQTDKQSVKSHESDRSSVRAKVNAGKERLKYAEMEAKVLREKALLEEMEAINAARSKRKQLELDATLQILKEEKAVAEAVAEANALDDVDEHDSLLPPETDKYDRVADYVESVQRPATCDIGHTNELTKFLLRKDLTLSRLTSFNDKAEDYQAWKGSFKTVCSEMGVSAAEELDLLVKWLGKESGRSIIRIRSACTHDPERGVKMAWERLEERYGTAEQVYKAVMDKLDKFPKITPKDSARLYDLLDILTEIEVMKENPRYAVVLSYFDSSLGIHPITNKLPYNIQEKWITTASTYKTKNHVVFPPFHHFVEFVRGQAKTRNDPSLVQSQPQQSSNNVISKKTDIVPSRNISDSHRSQSCLLHNTSKHNLETCRVFMSKPFGEKRKFLKDKGLCFKCFNPEHNSKDCQQNIICNTCGKGHNTIMHIPRLEAQGGETRTVTNCMQICGSKTGGKSCAKIVLVNMYHKENPENRIKLYAILDEQSNRSLAKSELFDTLNLCDNVVEYNLMSCGGSSTNSGRVAGNCVIESWDGQTQMELPSLLECDLIPNIRDEIPTPDVAIHHKHLSDIASQIPPLQHDAEIQLLLGRDFIEGHHVLEQRIGSQKSPYGQKLKLGWVVIGETCLGDIHRSNSVNVNKTFLLNNERSTVLEPCRNSLLVTEKHAYNPVYINGCIYDSIFQVDRSDDKPGLSIDDHEFLSIMNENFHKDENGRWTAPLPFRTNRQKLPNNREMAMKRAMSLDKSLSRNPTKKQQVFEFMEKIIANGHAERVTGNIERECWYLPVFGVTHPEKPGQVRCVFDSSATYNGVSLNDVLLTGPDSTNNLLGVLLRFRKEPVAIVGDVEQMFYNFYVREDHRDYLRFLWHEDNNPEKPIVDFRMTVHVFGNSPSPAIATFGLRKAVETSDPDVRQFVEDDFYVDDALTSLPTASEAIDLVQRTQRDLQESRIRLHKIASNDSEVINAFPTDQLAKSLKDVDLSCDRLPTQKSLGLYWDLNSDRFTFRVQENQKPYTRRGVLSVINSLFDPVGFLAPVTIQGRLILRDMMEDITDWDSPLPPSQLDKWVTWKASLKHLEDLHIPRTYSDTSFSSAVKNEIHVYADASELAIAAVSYLATYKQDGTWQTGFIMGKAKLAPKKGHTIPRLELCAAVLASEVAAFVSDQLNIDTNIKFHIDSKVVLGYINNTKRRFYTYVSNRVQRILKSTTPDQWYYVSTEKNPADCATRGIDADKVQDSPWLCGPTASQYQTTTDERFPLLEPDIDREVRSLATHTSITSTLGTERFTRYSSWKRLVIVMAVLRHFVASIHHSKSKRCSDWRSCEHTNQVEQYSRAEKFVVKEVQRAVYSDELKCLDQNQPVPRSSPIRSLDPFIDHDGIVRVGGRLKKSQLPVTEKHPIIVPGRSHTALLLVRHYHESVHHQGRHFTEGAIRNAGYWITGVKRLVSSVIHQCVKCRKLRGSLEYQKMADLPVERVEEAPPFTFVGVDTFGPWQVVSRKTRGGTANSKRWAILFTCLGIRAIHIEVVDEMSSSAFINAMRRFISIRGKVKEFRSDRGTNFVGSLDHVGIGGVNVEQGPVSDFLLNTGTVWKFNPPHSSHMGGVWERMIGVSRRILEAMLVDVKNLTHDVIVTLMAEVCAIVNARPLVPVSCDSEIPDVLTPNMILTHKTNPDTTALSTIDTKDMYRSQWKMVKHLADVFWSRWRKEFLQTLQVRRKWTDERENIKVGDVVLLKDKSVSRNDWPVVRVEEVFASEDGKVRSVKICVIKDGKRQYYVRPIVELVLLISEDKE